MKHVGKICSKCHPSTMDMVSLYRYRALIELAKDEKSWAPSSGEQREGTPTDKL